MDYGLGRMSSNAMLGMSGTGHLLNNNLSATSALENGPTRDTLRMASPSNSNSNNNNSEQLLSPNGHQQQQAVGVTVQSQGEIKFSVNSRNLSISL